MMFLILDRDPVKSALSVPDKLKFKQLLELAQMISTITGSVYKPVKQGKEIMRWIKEHQWCVKWYYLTLVEWCHLNINWKYKTAKDINTIYNTLSLNANPKVPQTAIFRYSKDYADTEYSTNSELPIDVVVAEYNSYIAWKKSRSTKYQ